MKALKIAMILFVALLAFTLSFAISGRYLNDVFHHKTLQALLEHEDRVEDVLQNDLKRSLREIAEHQSINHSEEEEGVCSIITMIN